jgi:hypothetical protein
MRQHVLSVNRGDQGTMMVEFALIDPRVQSGEFHLGNQVIGAIPVGAGGAAAAMAPNLPASGNGQPASVPANGPQRPAAPAQQQNACNTPQMANTPACRLNAKMRAAQTKATNQATAVGGAAGAVTETTNQIKGLVGGVIGTPAQTTAPQPQMQQSNPPAQQ